jgi:hypothetical protein
MKRRLTDDICDDCRDKELRMLAELSPLAVALIVAGLRALSLTKCNAHCRKIAKHLLDDVDLLGEWEARFCRSILAWHDQRQLSTKQIRTLYHVCRNAARRAINTEHRALRYMATVAPANTVPA